MVSLHDLLGEHILTAAEEGYEKDYTALRFTLDGTTYVATEDPSDGYRSYLGSLFTQEAPLTNTFEGQPVIGRVSRRDDELYEFVSAKTGLVILEVGTDYSEDYYPVCVLNFNPRNLDANQE